MVWTLIALLAWCNFSLFIILGGQYKIITIIRLPGKSSYNRKNRWSEADPSKVTRCPTRIAASSARGPSLPAELTSALKTPRFQLENSHIHTYKESLALFRSWRLINLNGQSYAVILLWGYGIMFFDISLICFTNNGSTSRYAARHIAVFWSIKQ